MLFNKMGHILGFQFLVINSLGLNQHDRTDSAKTIAAGFDNFDLLGQPLTLEFFLKGFLKFSSSGGMASRAATEHQLSSYFVHSLLLQTRCVIGIVTGSRQVL